MTVTTSKDQDLICIILEDKIFEDCDYWKRQRRHCTAKWIWQEIKATTNFYKKIKLTRGSFVKKQTSGIFKILKLQGGKSCFLSMEGWKNNNKNFLGVVVLADKQKN